MIIQERIPVSSTLTPDARVVLRQTPIAPDISIDNLAEDDPLRQIWSEFDPEQRVCINIIKNAGDTGIDRTGIEILMADNAVHRVNPVLNILKEIRTRIRDNPTVNSRVHLKTFFVKTGHGRQALQALYRFTNFTSEQPLQEQASPSQEVVCPNGATEVANAPITVVDPKPPTVVTPDNPYGLTAEAPSCNVDDLAKAGYHQKQNPSEQTPTPQIIYPDQPAEIISSPLTVVYPETAYPETEMPDTTAPAQEPSPLSALPERLQETTLAAETTEQEEVTVYAEPPLRRLGGLDARHKATRTTTARVVVKHPTTKPPVTTQSEGKGQPRSSQVVAPRPGLVFHGTEWLSLRAKKTVPAEPTTLSTTQKPDFLARLTPLEKAVFSQFESLDDTKVQTISESDLARAACGPYATMQTAIASLNNALRSLERKLFDENLLLIKAHGKQGYSYSLIPRPPDGQGVLFKKKSA